MNLRDLDDYRSPSPSHSHSLSHFSVSHRNTTGSFFQQAEESKGLLQTAIRSRSTPSLSELRQDETRGAISPIPAVNVNRNVLSGIAMLTGLDDANTNGVEVRVLEKDRLATSPKMLDFPSECQCKKHPHSMIPSSSPSSSSEDGLSCYRPSRVSSCPACSPADSNEAIPIPPTVSLSSFRACNPSFHHGPSPILPECLYLGDYSDASNLHLLLERNIGVVINVTAEVSNYFPRKLVYYKYFFVDLPTQSISHVFDEVSAIIDDYIYTHKKAVLIHCFAGVSRSASFVIAYLMKSLGMNYENAFNFVKERRKIIYPNDGFRKQLQEYEGKLKVERAREKETNNFTACSLTASPVSPRKILLPVISFAEKDKEKEKENELQNVNGLANALGDTPFCNFPAALGAALPNSKEQRSEIDNTSF